ncbi:MAG TPA: RNA polymerase sigma factor [Ktedonobacterales bacterium]|nr:RNA polymerase sigma factor [Ktedonobacterales bacterium]
MTTPEPTLLLRRIADGDEEALRQLYVEYRPRLRRYLWHQLDGDGLAIEEALQDTFLAVWRSAGGYRGEAKFATWLFQIAHYVALRTRKASAQRGRSETEIASDPPEGAVIPMAASPEDTVLEQLAFDEALSRLTPKHRAVLQLVFQQGFSAEEAAQILGVPVGTVKSRVSYARRALQSALACRLSEEARHDA